MTRNDLIFDVGMHLGEDTDFYLKKGYKVVAIEANPHLVNYCSERFSSDILKGNLVIISGAVARDRSEGSVVFFQNANSVWGTIDEGWATRNAKLGSPSVEIVVRVINVQKLFSKFGVPHYLKIDIEGQDLTALLALKGLGELPHYVSVEFDKVDFAELTREFNIFSELGYKKFKIVQQACIPNSQIKASHLNGSLFEYTFPPHSSGTFGEELGGSWLNYAEALRAYRAIFVDYQLYGDNSVLRKINPWDSSAWRDPGWYDTHASLY